MTRSRRADSRARFSCRVLLGLLFVSPALAAWQGDGSIVQGVVFDDRNDNGVRDTDDAGVAGVAVSNQVDVTITGADGSYRLPGIGTGVIFVSVPDGKRTRGGFWTRPASGRADFALITQPTPQSFTFIHASDTHVSAQSLPRLERLRQLTAERRPAFVLVSGDLVQDALRVSEDEARGYYDLYTKTTAAFPVPVWSVPGNHENFGIERHRSLVSPKHPLYGKAMYRARLGPNYYSFSYGGIHFVGLDSVDIDDLWYYGHIDRVQLAWLQADLAAVPRGTPVVTFNHIPFVTSGIAIDGYQEDGPAPSVIRINGKPQYRHVVSNLIEVLPILAPYRWTIALGGHLHRYETIRLAPSVATRFYQTAAIVGPTAGVMPAESGFTVYRVQKGEVDEGTFVPLGM